MNRRHGRGRQPRPALHASGYTRAMNKTSRSLMLVAAASALLVLTACGNKGPLVMPQKPVPVEEQEVKPADAPPAGQSGAGNQTQDQKADGHDHE